MACHRVDKFLQVIRDAQKAARLTEDLAPDCGRISLHDQDPYGEVEGTPPLFVKAEVHDVYS